MQQQQQQRRVRARPERLEKQGGFDAWSGGMATVATAAAATLTATAIAAAANAAWSVT